MSYTPKTFGTFGRTLHKADLSTSDYDGTTPREAVADIADANVVSSVLERSHIGVHMPVIDLDVPARLIPSSTPGHTHLYIDMLVTSNRYWRILDALADAGIVERGYVAASKERGYTSVRLPWIKKETPLPSPSCATCDGGGCPDCRDVAS